MSIESGVRRAREEAEVREKWRREALEYRALVESIATDIEWQQPWSTDDPDFATPSACVFTLTDGRKVRVAAVGYEEPDLDIQIVEP